MATINRFEDLEIWQEVRRLSKAVFLETINSPEFKSDFRFRDQIRAASGSVIDNIAEGFERNGNMEFRQFLSTAKASAGEVRSQIYRAFDYDYIETERFEQLVNEYSMLSGKINNFIIYLNKKDFKGTKFQ